MLGTISSFAYRHRETKKENLCEQGFFSQDSSTRQRQSIFTFYKVVVVRDKKKCMQDHGGKT